MSRGVKWGIGIGCLVLLLLCGAGLVFALTRIPPVEQQLPIGRSGIQISRGNPGQARAGLSTQACRFTPSVTADDPIEFR